MIGKKSRKLLGKRNGINVYSTLKSKPKLVAKTKLKTHKPMNKITVKQKARNKIWSENTNLRILQLNNRCEWCGKLGQRTGTDNFLSGHHKQKRRFKNDDISNVYVCHWLTCHCEIESKSINVNLYPNKEAWEKRNGHNKTNP
jgi:hypothetical protein